MNYILESYSLISTTWCCENCGSCARVSQLFTCDIVDGQRRRYATPRAAPFYSGIPVTRESSVIWTARCDDCVSHPAPEVPGYLRPSVEPESFNLEDLDL